MPSHDDFLCVLTRKSARPPWGLELHSPGNSPRAGHGDIDLQRRCSQTLEEWHVSSPSKARRRTQHIPDGGGFTMDVGPYCHFATRNGVSAVFSGEVSAWPGVDLVSLSHDAFVRGEGEGALHDDATWLLDFYETFKEFVTADVTENALTSLAQVLGRFAFVIYDGDQKRVLAARDAAGVQPLHWGVTGDGRFMFGSCADDLIDCNPTATPFPAGTLYASEGEGRACSPGDKGWVMAAESWPGQIFSFMRTQRPASRSGWREIKAIPRVTSQGCVHGAVYRVASEQQLAPGDPRLRAVSARGVPTTVIAVE